MKLYLAGPLFTEAERDWLRNLNKEVESLAASQNCPVNVIWPCDLIIRSEIEPLGNQAKREIFSRCKSHLNDADLLIALLDGPQVDDDTAWEIGHFYARRRPQQKIIGVRTDFKRTGESEGTCVNAMIEVACDWVVRTREDIRSYLAICHASTDDSD